MITKSAVIQVEGKSRLQAEQMLGEAFNKWTSENQQAEIFHLFEPVRKDELYGDYNYNRYLTSLTFFYRIPRKCALRELTEVANSPACT